MSVAPAKRLAVLGSTGSIGTQALEVAARERERVQVVALAAGRSLEALVAQARIWRPDALALEHAADAAAARAALAAAAPGARRRGGPGRGGAAGGGVRRGHGAERHRGRGRAGARRWRRSGAGRGWRSPTRSRWWWAVRW